jgi:prolyl oligopeptidase
MRELGDVIDRATWASPSFLANGKSFAYMRLPKLDPTVAPTDAYLNGINYFHVLGASPDSDFAIFGNGIGGVSMISTDFPVVTIIPGGQYVRGIVEHGVQAELTVYIAPEQEVGRAGLKWKKIIDVSDDVTGVAVHGNDLFLLSHGLLGAMPGFRLQSK